MTICVKLSEKRWAMTLDDDDESLLDDEEEDEDDEEEEAPKSKVSLKDIKKKLAGK